MSWSNLDLVDLIVKKTNMIMEELKSIKKEIKEIKNKEEGNE